MKKKSRRIVALLSSVCMISSALCFPVLAEDTLDPITYFDGSGLATTDQYTVLDGTTTTWEGDAWYYLDSDITYDTKIEVTGGDVSLILKDGCTLTAEKGIDVTANRLYVYNSSEEDNGKIVATSTDSAGIQIIKDNSLWFYGGTIEATGAEGYAGIGGASNGACGSIYVYGGKIKAQGGNGGAGIGAGNVDYMRFRNASVEAKAGSGTAPGIGYWSSLKSLDFYDDACIDSYGGSVGGPGIGFCGSTELSPKTHLYTGTSQKGYIHAQSVSKAFSVFDYGSDYSYFYNLSKWAVFYGDNGEDCALKNERDVCIATQGEVWIKPCTHPDAERFNDNADSSHRHNYECTHCAYSTSKSEPHEFDATTHECICGHREYPITVNGCPNDWEYVAPNTSGLGETFGYIASGRSFQLNMISEDLGDTYCASLYYVDPKTSSRVELFNDALTYQENLGGYIIEFNNQDEKLRMPETDVSIQVYEKYVVSFDGGEGSGSMDTVRVCPYRKYLLPTNQFNTPAGSVFYGWKVNDDTTLKQAGESITLTGDTVLTAVYMDEGTTPVFTSHSLILTGQIGIRFCVKYPSSVDPENSYMVFNCSDGKSGRMYYLDATQLDERTVIFEFFVNPLELADTVSATLYYGDGEKIGDTYSVMDYINTVMGDTDGKYEAEKPLVEALWRYGYQMQSSGWTDNRSNHAEIPSIGLPPLYSDEIKAYLSRFKKVGTVDAGINSVMYSLTLTSDTNLHFYISLDENVTITSVEGAEALGQVTISGKKYYRYSIKGISPQNLNVLQQISVTTNLGTAYIKASPMSYVYDVNFVIPTADYDASNKKQISLLAYYFYHRAAVKYCENNNT